MKKLKGQLRMKGHQEDWESETLDITPGAPGGSNHQGKERVGNNCLPLAQFHAELILY